jgi:hypothetical protein
MERLLRSKSTFTRMSVALVVMCFGCMLPLPSNKVDSWSAYLSSHFTKPDLTTEFTAFLLFDIISRVETDLFLVAFADDKVEISEAQIRQWQ